MDYRTKLEKYNVKRQKNDSEEMTQRRMIYDLTIKIYPELQSVINLADFDCEYQKSFQKMIDFCQKDEKPRKVLMDIYYGALWKAIKKEQKWEETKIDNDTSIYHTIFAGKNSQDKNIDIDIWHYDYSPSKTSYNCYGSNEYFRLFPETLESGLFDFNTKSEYLYDGCDFYGRGECGHKPLFSFWYSITNPEMVKIKLPI